MQNLENILVVVTREVDCTLVLEKAQILAAAANANTFVVRVIYDDVVDSGIPRAEDAQRLKTFIMRPRKPISKISSRTVTQNSRISSWPQSGTSDSGKALKMSLKI